jgi:hypothetical protein
VAGTESADTQASVLPLLNPCTPVLFFARIVRVAFGHGVALLSEALHHAGQERRFAGRTDTWHAYDQLKAELRRHAHKYIMLHDTTTYGQHGESPGHGGLWPAVEELLALGTFKVKARYANNNGLTVLEGIPANVPLADKGALPEVGGTEQDGRRRARDSRRK